MQSSKKSSSQKNRDYICPCGKQYFSYPALYTHIKCVHKGKPPGQVRRPEISDRGRPKINQETRIKEYKAKVLDDINDNPIQELIRFMNNNNAAIENITKASLDELVQLHPLNQVFLDLQKKQKDEDTKQVAQYIAEYNIKNIHTGAGLAQFLLQIQQKLQLKGYLQIKLLMLIFIQHIIQESQDFYVLATSYMPFIIDYANDFIINGLKEKIHNLFDHLEKDRQRQGVSVIDKTIEQKDNKIITFETNNGIFILNILFKWMIFKQYTLSKTLINHHYVE